MKTAITILNIIYTLIPIKCCFHCDLKAFKLFATNEYLFTNQRCFRNRFIRKAEMGSVI